MPQASLLPDGRLHLHHGPIDLIIDAWGSDKKQAFVQATARFQTLLAELAEELAMLRQPVDSQIPQGAVARRMFAAVAPIKRVFVTPMAAVAGAVADEVCMAMRRGLDIEKSYVNNGGDIAFYVTTGQKLVAAIADGGAGRVALSQSGGLATSGWRGRSHSLGIADAVTVVANCAAQADVAATLIANAVNLPGHSAIERQPASDLAPDSDLGARPVTTGVGPLSTGDIDIALEAGRKYAHSLLAQGHLNSATLFLAGQNLTVGGIPPNYITGEKHARLQTA